MQSKPRLALQLYTVARYFNTTLHSQHVLTIAVAIATAVYSFGCFLLQFVPGGHAKIALDYALAPGQFFIVLFPLFFVIPHMHKHVQQGLSSFFLTHVNRTIFILGFAGGCLISLLLVLWAFYACALLWLYAELGHWALFITPAYASITLQGAVLLGIALACACSNSQSIASFLFLASWFIGYNASQWQAVARQHHEYWFAPLYNALYYLLPNLAQLDNSDTVLYQLHDINAHYVAHVVHALLLCAAFTTLAIILIHKKSLS